MQPALEELDEPVMLVLVHTPTGADITPKDTVREPRANRTATTILTIARFIPGLIEKDLDDYAVRLCSVMSFGWKPAKVSF